VQLIGKVANLGDDIAGGYLTAKELEVFKKVVTADSMYTDVKGKAGINFVPMSTLVFSMNDFPRLQDSTEGVMRRLAPVPFRRTFTPDDDDYDPNIATKLAAPDVLKAAAVAAMLHLPYVMDKRTYSTTEDMRKEVEMLRVDNNSILRWIEDEGLKAEDFELMPVRDTFTRYREWCQSTNERYCKTQKALVREFEASMGLYKIRYTDENNRTVMVFSKVNEDINRAPRQTVNIRPRDEEEA
jgi:putative DNA primase/helicase